MNNRGLLRQKVGEFKQKGLPAVDIAMLLRISHDNPKTFTRYAQRRLFGEPFPYVTHRIAFLGKQFYIDRRVYIPNLETQTLARETVRIIPRTKPYTVLEVGIGCGAIATSIKLARPRAKVYAVDIDPAALQIATMNARTHKANITVSESYYVDDYVGPHPDIVVADLPYGNTRHVLHSNTGFSLRHLPPVSLFHPLGILAAYQELIASIAKRQWSTILLFETGRVNKSIVAKIIPKESAWEYKKYPNGYSITKLVLHPSRR